MKIKNDLNTIKNILDSSKIKYNYYDKNQVVALYKIGDNQQEYETTLFIFDSNGKLTKIE